MIASLASASAYMWSRKSLLAMAAACTSSARKGMGAPSRSCCHCIRPRRKAVNEGLRSILDRLFTAVEAKDVAAAVECFAEESVCIDPHYPVPRMVGKPAIAEGLRWVFGAMEQLGFTPLNYFEARDGQSAAIEMATSHRLPGGRQLKFSQTFVIETCDGHITRLQAYPPYGPG